MMARETGTRAHEVESLHLWLQGKLCNAQRHVRMVGANIAPKLIGFDIQLISPSRCTFRRNSTREVAILMQFGGASCPSFGRGFSSASRRHWQLIAPRPGRCRATPNGKVIFGHAKSPSSNQRAADSYSIWSARHSCKLAC